jgi:hypothetical protein
VGSGVGRGVWGRACGPCAGVCVCVCVCACACACAPVPERLPVRLCLCVFVCAFLPVIVVLFVFVSSHAPSRMSRAFRRRARSQLSRSVNHQLDLFSKRPKRTAFNEFRWRLIRCEVCGFPPPSKRRPGSPRRHRVSFEAPFQTSKLSMLERLRNRPQCGSFCK